MNKEELKKEFEKYLKDSSDYYDPREPLTERKLLQMWLDCAEPREKRIADLEEKNKELTLKISRLESDCDAYSYSQRTYQEEIKELKAQIEKMKCCCNCKWNDSESKLVHPPCKECNWDLNKWEIKEK